jgi:hypothetical protein
MGNPPLAYKQLSSNSSRTVKNLRAGPKTFVYTRVSNLGDFPLENQRGIIFEKYSWHF